MTSGLDNGAGRALRVSPRALARGLPACALALVLVVAACGGSGASGAGPGSAAESGGSESGSQDPALELLPDRIGGVELEVIEYPVPDALDVVGGPQVSNMLATLGLTTADVTLVMAVDRASLLAIGRWGLPDKDAGAILAAWKGAVGAGWTPATLGGEPALAGRGPDGRQAWAVAREGTFVYIVTDDPSLAEQAVSATN